MSRSSGDDEVGYGRPPRSGQFKPGQSGNPLGRPRKVAKPRQLLPIVQPTRKMLESVARHPVVVREADKRFEIATSEAVIRSLAKTAMQGGVMAQRTWLQFQLEQDQINEANRRDTFQFWQDYVNRKRAEIDHARRSGRTIPEPLPHPDDIAFDYAELDVRFTGPRDEQDVQNCKREWSKAQFLIELMVYQGLDMQQIVNSTKPEIDLIPLLFLLIASSIPSRFRVTTAEDEAGALTRICMTPARQREALRDQGRLVGLPLDPERRLPKLDLRIARVRIVDGWFEPYKWRKGEC